MKVVIKFQMATKLHYVPLNPMFTYDHYYQSDFISLMKNGLIIVKTNDKQTIQHIKWLEHLCGKAYVVHEADIVTEGELEK